MYRFIVDASRDADVSGYVARRVTSDLYRINFQVTSRLHEAVTGGNACTGCTHACILFRDRGTPIHVLARADARLPLSNRFDRLLDRVQFKRVQARTPRRITKNQLRFGFQTKPERFTAHSRRPRFSTDDNGFIGRSEIICIRPTITDIAFVKAVVNNYSRGHFNHGPRGRRESSQQGMPAIERKIITTLEIFTVVYRSRSGEGERSKYTFVFHRKVNSDDIKKKAGTMDRSSGTSSFFWRFYANRDRHFLIYEPLTSRYGLGTIVKSMELRSRFTRKI